MKIAINNESYSVFDLSDEAWEYIGLKRSEHSDSDIDTPEFRTNPKLIECIEVLGDRVNYPSGWVETDISIIEIPDEVKQWHIAEYEGKEYVREGLPIELSETKQDNRYVIELNGKVLVSRQTWELDFSDEYYYRFSTYGQKNTEFE